MRVEVDVVLEDAELAAMAAGRPQRRCRPYTLARQAGLAVRLVGYANGFPVIELDGPDDAVTDWVRACGYGPGEYRRVA